MLLDRRGNVTETATANILAYRAGEGLVTPPPGVVLPGISLMALRGIADAERIALVERDLSIADLTTADEVFLTSTPNCLLPVVNVNGVTLGHGTLGSVFRRLLKAWSDAVGLDIAEQARRFGPM